jgi:L-rhamnose isomerase
MRQRESLLREKIVAKENVAHGIYSDNDEELQRDLHDSQHVEEYARWVREQGGQNEHDGGSFEKQCGALLGMLKRSTSRKVTPMFWHHPLVFSTHVPLSYIFLTFVSYYLSY